MWTRGALHLAGVDPRAGYRTPVGTFKPIALVRYHRSTIYSGSPMPYSIFFLRGTPSTVPTRSNISGVPPRMLYQAASSNAAALYSLVKRTAPATP